MTAAVVVAHPDDETLWAGGTILSHPDWRWLIVTLCREHDPDRAPRFSHALKRLGARGRMADLDDGPAQTPLPEQQVEQTVLSLLGRKRFDVVLTHGPHGEYTRHLRHEEVSTAVAALWQTGRVRAQSLQMFAYEDGGKRYLPRAAESAHVRTVLADDLWRRKYRIITEIYGFRPESFEAQTTPREEAFWRFDSPQAFRDWMEQEGGR
jgi:LmbE family N-acetylglucosaminyl deacetylase